MGRSRLDVEELLRKFLARKGFCSDEDLIVAYSGGPDSTALLAALCAISNRKPIAVHVDHGIRDRDELDAERKLVVETCKALGAKLLVAKVRPGALVERARSRAEGVEAAARGYRYAAMREAIARTGAKAVLLAHTRDDQVETILMRLLGGAGAGGLKGMPEASGPFMRPFLGIDKASLLAYLEKRGIPYSTDSTNVSEKYLRNRIRKNLVPLLDSSFRGWRRGLSLMSSKAARDEEALSAAADALAVMPSGHEPSEFTVSSQALLEAPVAISSRAIVRTAGRLLGTERFSSRMALAALEALKRGGDSLYRGAGVELFVRDNLVILRRGLDFPLHGGYFVLIDRPCRIRVGSLDVRAAWSPSSGIRADAFSFPLVVRSRRPGDALAQKDGTKRLDELFAEWALPPAARLAAPIVEDRDGIVAVLGAAFGGKDRYRALPSGDGPVGACARLSVIVKGA